VFQLPASLLVRSAESWGHAHHPPDQARNQSPVFGRSAVEVLLYWDDIPGRRLRPDLIDGEQALEQAKAFARAERERRTA
jgi:hypothetical protein